ncbi:MAG: hypothetical protein AAF911_10370 [Planctomycetota bacterium]
MRWPTALLSSLDLDSGVFMFRRVLSWPSFRSALPAALVPALVFPAAAQPLVEHVPVDAVAYFGWAGTDSLTDAYAQSTLQDVIELIDTDKLRTAWRSAMPTLRQEIDDPEFQQQTKHLTELWGVSVRGAMAVYVTLPPSPAGGEPPATLTRDFEAGASIEDVIEAMEADASAHASALPGVVLLWQPVTGDDRKDLLDGLKFYQAKSTHRSELVVDGPIVSLRINQPPPNLDPDVVIDPEAPGSLADVPRFAEAVAQLETPGPLFAYFDVPALVADAASRLTNTSTVHEHDGTTHSVDAANPALALFEPLGLYALGPAVITSGFDARGWRTQAYLSAPAPRIGLASLLDAPALTADDLGRPPAEAPWMTAVSFDTNLLMDLVREVANALGPDQAGMFEEGLATASGMVGVDVENQLIRGFGPAWSMYVDPDAAGTSLMSLTVVNRLLDPEGVERGMRSVQMFANLAMLGAMADEDFKVQVHTQTYGDVDLHTLGTPLLSPTWAIVEGQLVAGLMPHTVLNAIDRLDQPNSLAQQDDFAALRENIGTRRLTSISWVDLQQTAANSYQNFLLLESLVTGGASMATGQPMPMVLPPLGRLKPYLEPAHGIGWVDDAGWHYDSVSPFPGATLLAPQTSSTSVLGPTSIGVLLPALGAARRTARQMADNTQGRGIHQAMVIYAQSNDSRMPDDIGVLIEGRYFTPEYAVSNALQNKIPAGIETWPIAEQADWVRANADLILVPGLTEDLDHRRIAVFLKPDIYNEPGEIGRGTVVYNDGSTEFTTDYDLLETQLIAQTGMTMQELIDRQSALADR